MNGWQVRLRYRDGRMSPVGWPGEGLYRLAFLARLRAWRSNRERVRNGGTGEKWAEVVRAERPPKLFSSACRLRARALVADWEPWLIVVATLAAVAGAVRG